MRLVGAHKGFPGDLPKLPFTSAATCKHTALSTWETLHPFSQNLETPKRPTTRLGPHDGAADARGRPRGSTGSSGHCPGGRKASTAKNSKEKRRKLKKPQNYFHRRMSPNNRVIVGTQGVGRRMHTPSRAACPRAASRALPAVRTPQPPHRWAFLQLHCPPRSSGPRAVPPHGRTEPSRPTGDRPGACAPPPATPPAPCSPAPCSPALHLGWSRPSRTQARR